MPEPPDGGVVAPARYFLAVVRARYQRRAGMRSLTGQIQGDVTALDGVLGSLGRAARSLGLDARPLVDENRAIDAAEARRDEADKGRADVARRIDEEQERFASVEKELEGKLEVARKAAEVAGTELARLQSLRRETRERRKDVEKKQRELTRGAELREKQAAGSQLDEQRASLRRSAEDLRADAARLEPERAELERAASGLDEEVESATARHDAARADLDTARKTLEDARAGHRHRRGELDAEAAQRARVASDATAEIGRRLVTLGTILNLNRVSGPETDPLYRRVDELRAAIAAREAQIEGLRAESARLDRAMALRGAGVLAAAFVLLVTLICVVVALT